MLTLHWQGLRSYATFLDEIMHDTEQADEFLQKARRVEESFLQQKTWSMSDMSFGSRVDGLAHMDEHDAVMVVCGSPARLGEIVSANTKSSTMLSIQRVVLTGRSLSSLFPPPVSNWIQAQLELFVESGDCFIINNPILMPVLTGGNVLIPVVMHLKEHPPEIPGSPPELMVVFKPVVHSSEIAMFDMEVG